MLLSGAVSQSRLPEPGKSWTGSTTLYVTNFISISHDFTSFVEIFTLSPYVIYKEHKSKIFCVHKRTVRYSVVEPAPALDKKLFKKYSLEK